MKDFLTKILNYKNESILLYYTLGLVLKFEKM